MKIEEMENGYKLTDLYITAAVLCVPGMELIHVETDKTVVKNKNCAMFVIKGDKIKIKSVIDSFFNGKHTVDAQLFKGKLQLLKSRLYANY